MFVVNATKYAQGYGFFPRISVFPLDGKTPLTSHGFKDATVDVQTIRTWGQLFPNVNIGLPTGSESGIIVIDIDISVSKNKTGDQSLLELEAKYGKLPDSIEARTGGGGVHKYFRYPCGVNINCSASHVAKDIDIRGNGGYIVAPPSVHPETLVEYAWVDGHSPLECPLAELPEAWIKLLASKNHNPLLGEKRASNLIPEGARNDTLFRLGSSLRAQCMPEDGIRIELWKANSSCSPPLSESEVETIIKSVLSYPPGVNRIIPSREMDDRMIFHRFNKKGEITGIIDYNIAKYIKDTHHFFFIGGVLYFYKNGAYKQDKAGDYIKTEIAKMIDSSIVTANLVDRVYRLIMMDKELQLNVDDINNAPETWINFRNGYYDPVNKTMHEHDPHHYMLNQIPHSFNPNTMLHGHAIDDWLESICPNRDDKEMLLEYAGYCLTGDTRLQKFLLITGPGGNGKSILISMIQLMVGEENTSNLSLQQLSQRFACYGLLNKLLNACADIPIKAIEDTSVIKQALGEDRIAAEPKGKDTIYFRNRARFVFSANEIPTILNERTIAFYRRLLVLEIDFTPARPNLSFKNSLISEINYLIYICVKALERMYERGGIIESNNSKKAILQLRQDSDTVEAWLQERCITDHSAKCERGVAYHSYSEFCTESGRKPLAKNPFFKALRSKGFDDACKTKGYYYFKGFDILNQL